MKTMEAVTYWPARVVPMDDVGAETQVEECAPEDAEFWGVYLQDSDGLHHHVSDFFVMVEALQLAESLSAVLEIELDQRYP